MRATFWTLVLVLFAAYLLTGIVQVRPGELAVVRRFGRVVATPGPGLWIGLPWGLDRVDRVPVDQVRRVPVGYQPDASDNGLTAPPGQLLTGDHNLVNIQVVVDYDVRPQDVVDYVVQAERAEGVIARTAESVLAEWVAGRSVDDVLLTDKAALPGWLLERTQERLEPYRIGVRLRAANVSYLLPPSEVKDAFDNVTRAQTEIRTLENKARETATASRREALIDKVRREQLSAAYVNERLRLARAEADSFEERRRQYQRLRAANPDFLIALWWEEMGRLFTRMQASGRIDLLDHYLGSDGLDLTQFAPQPPRK
jgi:membrane protease subunit HflK